MARPWLLSDLLTFLLSYPEIILAVACFILVGRAWGKRQPHALPVPLTNWPLVGMLPSLLLNKHRINDWCTQSLRAAGQTLVFRGPWFASSLDMLITCDPANVNYILATNFSNFPKGSDYLQIFDVLGDGIFNSESHSWRAQRRMAGTHMRFRGFRRFVAQTSREMVESKLIPLLQQLAENTQVVDFQDLLQRFTFDSTCTLVFGVNPNCLSLDFPTVPFARAVDNAKEVIHFRHTVPVSWWKLLRWLKVGQERKMADAWKTIDEFIFHHISTRREELKEPTKAGGSGEEAAVDLLTSYMGHAAAADEENDNTKSDQFLRDTVLNLLVAGRDTISAALTWFFWLVCKNPSVESKILAELERVQALPRAGAGKPVVFEAEQLNGLVYLHASLCEALRLYPSVPNVHKGVAERDVLPSGHRVNPGMRILYSLYAMARMEEIWGKDCLDFRPERWISGHGTLKFEYGHKFLVFNAGPRSCLGKDVSFTQMKAVAAAVISNFRVEVVEGQTIRPMQSIILYMENGLMVKIRERN